MNFNEFVNEVKGNIKLFLPKDYENAEVSTMECQKLNRAYTGLMVRKEGELLTPTINLNQLYEASLIRFLLADTQLFALCMFKPNITPGRLFIFQGT